MLKLGKDQMGELDRAIDAAFARDIMRYIRAEYEGLVGSLPEAELLRRVKIGIARAKGYGMTWESTIRAFVALMFEIAPTFDEQKQIRLVLTDETLPADNRIDALWDATRDEDWDEAEQLQERAEAFWSRPLNGAPQEG